MIKCVDEYKKFTDISCGIGFIIALSSSGLVYSSGTNKYGQLGLGGFNGKFDEFTCIETLKKSGEKIVEISCGDSHVACRGSSGKVYTWGNNTNGQLGHGNNKHYCYPQYVEIKQEQGCPYKCKSAQAGFGSIF